VTIGYEGGNRAALDHLEDLLDAYADERLMPRGPVLARIRANVLAEFAASAAGRREAVVVVGAPRRRFALPPLHIPRRAFALGMAASLSLGTAAAVLAAPPGSPFYNARLVIETALLPTEVDMRLAAYELHLDERLREVEAALASGDDAALLAALAAYRADVDAAVAVAGEQGFRLEKLQLAIEKHLAKLEELAASLPTEVARDNAVEHAIDVSEKAVEKLKEKSKKNNNRPPPPPGPVDRPDPANPDVPDPGAPNPNAPNPNAPDRQSNQNRP
jgi:hypothetical protein